MILTDTVKMKEHQQDPEMLLDLMYRSVLSLHETQRTSNVAPVLYVKVALLFV